jgi:hypothetical protein
MDLNQQLNDLEYTPDDRVWYAIENEARKKGGGIYDMKIVPPEICWLNIAEQISDVEKKKNKPKSIQDFPKWIRYAAVFTGITLGTIGLLNHSVRNKILNTVLESNLKTSLSDTQHLLPTIKKKPDNLPKNSVDQPTLPLKKN